MDILVISTTSWRGHYYSLLPNQTPSRTASDRTGTLVKLGNGAVAKYTISWHVPAKFDNHNGNFPTEPYNSGVQLLLGRYL